MNSFLLAVGFSLLGALVTIFLVRINKGELLRTIIKMRRNNYYYQEFQKSHFDNASRTANENRPSNLAIIYKSEIDYISKCILDYPNIETGGQLFGYWTSTGTPVVMYVIGPGRNAQHNTTSFIQDWDYLQIIGKELGKRYRLQHIGEWHSHHQLGLAHPSGGDVETMSYGVGKPGFPRLLLCIGNCNRTSTTVNAFNFHENTPKQYIHASWDIVNMESPYRNLVDSELRNILIHPVTRQASHEQIYSERNIIRRKDTAEIHWLTKNVENVETMKTFVSMVKSMCPGSFIVKTEILKSGEPLISIKDAKINIKLPYGFPQKGPVLLNEYGTTIEQLGDNSWAIGKESLSMSFGQWLSANLLPILQATKPVHTTENERTTQADNSILMPITEKTKNCDSKLESHTQTDHSTSTDGETSDELSYITPIKETNQKPNQSFGEIEEDNKTTKEQ